MGPSQSSLGRSLAVTFGLLCVALGVTPVLQAAGLIAAASNSSPWTTISAGLIFLAGGAVIIVDYALAPSEVGGRSRIVPVLQYLLSLVVTGAVAIVAAWIALGPGERGFAVAVPLLPAAASEVVGRAVFVVASMLTFCIFLLFAVAGALDLRGRRL